MRIIMIEDDEFEIARFTEYIDKTDDVELLATTDSATCGFELTRELKPDGVILDLELKEGNGIRYLMDLYEANFPKPFIIVTTWNESRSILQNARKHGAGFVQLKTQVDYQERGPQIVIDLIKFAQPYRYLDNLQSVPEKPQVSQKEQDEIKRKEISKALGVIGINAGTNGHILLVEAILAGSKEGSGLIDMENVIYPILVKRFCCTKGAAEKSMRTTIEVAWLSTDPEILEREFTQHINPEKGKPELKAFISYYASLFR